MPRAPTLPISRRAIRHGYSRELFSVALISEEVGTRWKPRWSDIRRPMQARKYKPGFPRHGWAGAPNWPAMKRSASPWRGDECWPADDGVHALQLAGAKPMHDVAKVVRELPDQAVVAAESPETAPHPTAPAWASAPPSGHGIRWSDPSGWTLGRAASPNAREAWGPQQQLRSALPMALRDNRSRPRPKSPEQK